MASGDAREQRLRRELIIRSFGNVRPTGAAARQLADAMEDAFFQAGETIYQRGDEADAMYLVVRGEVVMTAPGEEDWSFDAGSIIGSLDINLQRRRARDAVAVTDVEAQKVLAADWREVLEDNFDHARMLVSTVGRNLWPLTLELSPDGGFADPVSRSPPEGEAPVMSGPAEALHFVEQIALLQRTRCFSSATVRTLRHLAAASRPIALEAGEVLFEAGTARGVAIVARGVVRIERALPPELRASFGGATIVGGPAALGRGDVEHRAVAVTPALVLWIAFGALDDVLEDHFDLTLALLHGFALQREELMAIKARRAAQRGEARSMDPPLPLGTD